MTGFAYESYQDISASINGSSTEYQVITIPVNQNFASVDLIKSLGFRFRNVKASGSAGGSVIIDYIFVGKRRDLPDPLYEVTFRNEDGTVLQRSTTSMGGSVTYTGSTPTRISDETSHYTFNGWDKALTNITADTTITATYTAAAHTWTCGMEH